MRIRSSMRPCAHAALGGLALLTLSCAPLAETEPDAWQRVTLPDTEWVLSSLNGRSPLAGTRISIEFEPEGGGGYSGCNWYGGRYEATDSTIEFGAITSTARGCIPESIVDQEVAFHRALGGARFYGAREGRLEMADSSGSVTLVFEPRAKLPMNPADLVGTQWKLRSGGGLGEVTDTTVTLSFEDGTASGFAGCRDFTATYEARGDRIFFTSISMASTECNRGDAVSMGEGQYTTDLSESTYWRLSGNELELSTVGGRRLLFAAR